MQALLGSASRDGTRRDLIRECGRIAAGEGLYRGSSEELTPVRLDWLSAVPLVMTTLLLLASPPIASSLARGSFGARGVSLRAAVLPRSSDATVAAGHPFLNK